MIRRLGSLLLGLGLIAGTTVAGVVQADEAVASTGVGVTVEMDCPPIDGVTIYRPEAVGTCGPTTANGVTMLANRFTNAFAPQLSSRTHRVQFDPGSRTAPFVCIRWEAIVPARTPPNATRCVTAPAAGSSATLDFGIPTVWSSGYLSNTCNGTTTGTDWSAMWCVNEPSPFRYVEPLFWWYDTDPNGANMGPPPAAPAPVGPPALTCSRSIKIDANGGGGFVTAVAVVSNEHVQAADVFSWRFPWESTWREGQAVAGGRLPAFSEMPPGGWRAQCRVVRTIASGGSASGRWTAGAAARAVQDCATTDVGCLDANSGWQGAALLGAGVATRLKIATPLSAEALKLLQPAAGSNLVHLPGLGYSGAAPPAVTAPATGAGAWSILGGAAAVIGAGVAGYLAGGLLASAGLDEALGMDLGWLCNNNPGYAALNNRACAELAFDSIGLRSDTEFINPDGTNTDPASSGTTWTTAVATAEVLIDPTNPTRGRTTTATAEDPATNPDGSPNALLTPERLQGLESVANDPTAVPSADPGADDNVCPTGFGILNPFAFGKLMRCLFIPTDLTADSVAGGTCSTQFPCSWLAEGHAAAVLIHTDLAGGVDGQACGPSVGFDLPDSIATSVGRDDYRAVLPTPSGLNCPGNGPAGARTADDDKVGDLFGYRSLVRNVARVFLGLGFLALMMSHAPWDRQRDFTLGTEGTAAEPQGTLL